MNLLCRTLALHGDLYYSIEIYIGTYLFQECFKNNWSVHKAIHKAGRKYFNFCFK